MLRDFPPGRKPVGVPCPSCGSCGGYVGHGSYERYVDDGSGERRLRVSRVRCKACGATHALLPPGVEPRRLRTAGLRRAVAGAWARGLSMASLSSTFGIPPTSLRRLLARAASALGLPSARSRDRAALACALAAPT